MQVRNDRWLTLLFSGLAACRGPVEPTSSSSPAAPAEAARCDLGIDDPFRHLEALEKPEVQAWMRERTQRAEAALDALPGLEELVRDHATLDGHGADALSGLVELPSGAQLYLRADADGERLVHREAGGKERVLYDPSEGEHRVINYFQPSWSGERVVVGLTKDGEELGRMIVLEVASGRRLADAIGNSWPSDSGGVHWLPDDSGFVYVHHPVTEPQAPGFLHDMEAVIHRLGAAPGAREVVLSAAHDPGLGLETHDFPMVFVPHADSEYAVAVIAGATPHAASFVSPIADFMAGTPRWRPLFAVEDKVAHFTIVGDHVDVLSARRRPEYEILRVDLAAPNLEKATLLAAPPEGETIAQMAVRGDELVFVSWRDGVVASLHHRDAAGRIGAVELPAAFGEIMLEHGEPVPGAGVTSGSGALVEAGGWLSPRRRYRYDFAGRRLEPEALEAETAPPFLAELIVDERTAIADDGTTIPLSLIYRRDLPRDGARPTLIYGYGSYGLSATPFFYAPFLLWAQRGGVVAIAHVRGGGEKGEGWHESGRKQAKANTWRDAIACAEALQSTDWGFTAPEHTAIWGMSAGGVLAGRAITEAPERFGAALIQVGMLNPARLEVGGNGDNSAKEFGSLDEPRECEALLEMDAYLHVRDDATYPAVLLTTGINDPRVDPWESSKFAARLEQANASAGGGGPTLLWIDDQGGHGAGETRAARYPKIARALAFALWQTGHPDFQP